MWVGLLSLAILAYGAFALFAFFCAEAMAFAPAPRTYGADAQGIVIRSSQEGRQIALLYLPKAGARHVLLVGHGNGEDLGVCRDWLGDLADLGVAVCGYDYPGYGASSAGASELGCYDAIATAYRFLTRECGFAPGQIVVHGRSVGGGPATWLASREPVAGLILESSFVSLHRVLTRWPLLPWDRFANLSRLASVRCPVLVMHGDRDMVIPTWHGRRLYDVIRGPKQCLWVAGAGHNDLQFTAGLRYGAAIQDFLAGLEEAPAASLGRP